ncbi:glutaredoxin 3 [Kordia sp. SMS9]|uniref:glutaredoxin family protein n=1 Tax=Kordia sp. SMS9 TaxID=2282170 RepID=UPI000E0D6FBE|nr:glutaredoxin family protein [Kordia sp. SMS9]AXG70697.1 glutaredoxin 3 [Kordia sp. SMS9]
MKNLLFTIVCITFAYANTVKDIVKSDESKHKITKTIIVYGSDTCHFCVDTKQFLKDKKVTFTYFDVDVNNEKLQEMLQKLRKANIPVSNLSLPVIDKNGEIFTNSEPFEAFLEKIIQ